MQDLQSKMQGIQSRYTAQNPYAGQASNINGIGAPRQTQLGIGSLQTGLGGLSGFLRSQPQMQPTQAIPRTIANKTGAFR